MSHLGETEKLKEMTDMTTEEKPKDMSNPCVDECAICDPGIRKTFVNTLGAIFCPTTKTETVERIDKNTQTFLDGMYKYKKPDNTISEKDPLIPKRCSSVLDHTGEGDSTKLGEIINLNRKSSSLVEGDVFKFKVVSSKQSENTDENTKSRETLCDNEKKRTTNKENLCRLDNEVSTIKGQVSTVNDMAHFRMHDNESVSDGERSSNVDISHETKQKKEGTSQGDKYGLKDTQTSESYSSDVIITYDLRDDVVYLKSKCLPCQESVNVCQPNIPKFVNNDPNAENIVTLNAEESFHSGKQESETASRGQETTEPAAFEILEKRNPYCTTDDHKHSTAMHVINNSVNEIKSDYDKFTIVEYQSDESKPEEVNITNNAPKFPDMDSEKYGPNKKQHKNSKFHKQTTEHVDSRQRAEKNDENVQENRNEADDAELRLDNKDTPLVTNSKKNVIDIVDTVKITNVSIPTDIPSKLEETKDVYTYDEANNVWNLEKKGIIDWDKKQSMLPTNAGVPNPCNPTSAVPYMGISGVFDRGAQYRMDDKQVIVKCRRGKKKEITPKKVKRKGIPNKHLRKKIDYFEENAFEKDYDDLNETNNSKTDVIDKVLSTVPFPYKCETEQKILQQEEALPDITPEQIAQLGDNHNLLSESNNVILRKMGEWNKLEEKYAVKKSPKLKGNKTKKTRKRAAGNKVNFIAMNSNNSANDESSTEDDDSDTTSDDEDDDFDYVICFHSQRSNQSSTTLEAAAMRFWVPLD